MKYTRFSKNDKLDYNLVFVYEDKLSGVNKSIGCSKALKDIKKAVSQKLICGKLGSMEMIVSTMYDSNYFLIGLGKKSELTIQKFEKYLSSVIKKINKYDIGKISLDLSDITIKNYDVLKGSIIEFEKSNYNFKNNSINHLKECFIKVPNNITKKAFDDTKRISLAIAHGLNTARKLGDTPPNICNPTFLARESKKLEKLHKNLKVEVLDEKQMRALKMGSLLSVSQGSTQPAKLVIIKYTPLKNKQPIVLVGKGITFDTGGISLKPSPSVDEMKYDMSGAGSVVGTMQACAEMNLKNNVIGILACAENMPSGVATRPGDVVKSMSGITIEILNTDAEGRLVLCDALTFSKKYKPKYILDMATLTGACLVGLGKYPSGLFSNNSTLTQKIKKSADVTGDRVWELPLYSDYFDELKTNFADIQNIGGRYGGAITAAAFLANFTKDEKWAHLDIAGTAWESGNDKGSTGRPVKLLTDFVMTNK